MDGKERALDNRRSVIHSSSFNIIKTRGEVALKSCKQPIHLTVRCKNCKRLIDYFNNTDSLLTIILTHPDHFYRSGIWVVSGTLELVNVTINNLEPDGIIIEEHGRLIINDDLHEFCKINRGIRVTRRSNVSS